MSRPKAGAYKAVMTAALLLIATADVAAAGTSGGPVGGASGPAIPGSCTAGGFTLWSDSGCTAFSASTYTPGDFVFVAGLSGGQSVNGGLTTAENFSLYANAADDATPRIKLWGSTSGFTGGGGTQILSVDGNNELIVRDNAVFMDAFNASTGANGEVRVRQSDGAVMLSWNGAVNGQLIGEPTTGNLTLTGGNLIAPGLTLNTTPLEVGSGGTGRSTLTAHAILFGNGTSAPALLTPGTTGLPLVSQGASADPAYAALGVSGGGTGVSTCTAYDVVFAGTTATGAFQCGLGLGTSGQVLTSAGAGALPSWTTLSTGANPAGSGSELQYRSSGTAFGALPSSSVSGANVVFGGNVSIADSGLLLTSVISPTALSGDQNDYAPTGGSTASIWRLSTNSSTARTLTGISGGATGRVLTLLNLGPGFIVLYPEHGGSTAANRFATPGAGFALGHFIAPSASLTLIYDGTSSRWRGLGFSYSDFWLGAASAGTTLTRFYTSANSQASLVDFNGTPSKLKLGSLDVLAGSSSTYAAAGGTLDTGTTQTGNTAATETDLYSYSVPASVLGANGQTLHMDCGGTFAGSVTTDKRLRVKYGGTTLFDTGALSITSAASWKIQADVLRTGATTQKGSVEFHSSSSVLAASSGYSTAAETLSGAVTIKITGQGTNASDVVGEWCKVYWRP